VSALTASARGRAKAEELMTDTCVINRITGWTLDPNTGANTPTLAPQYSGKCRVKVAGASTAQDSSVGETSVPQIPTVVSVPTSVITLAEGDQVTISASNDPELVGKVLLIKAIQTSTHITARRLLCEELS
jgi:sulfite reductase alpha subunit-like flavoprotein